MPRKHLQDAGRGQPPKRPMPHDESVDEPAKLIEQETADIEGEVPQTPNPRSDRGEKDEQTPPIFEE